MRTRIYDVAAHASFELCIRHSRQARVADGSQKLLVVSLSGDM